MVLKEGGGKPLHTDQSLYSWHNSSGSLILLLSTHVDDLKGCGEEAEVTKVLALLTKHFGKLKTDRLKFEHCGVWHEQDLAAKTVYMHQAHYSAQLKLMDVVGLDPTKPEVVLNEKQASEYMSLLGALGWLSQARLDLSIYICALQRAAKAPRAEHAFRLNKVCKWARRKKCGLLYRKVKTPIRVVTVSDAAFRKEDAQGLAIRGAVTVSSQDSDTPGGDFMVVEFYARKQKRVTRSTFSAELNALSDAHEFGRLITLTLSELTRPLPSARALILLDEQGRLPIPHECVVDAKNVFDSLCARDPRTF